MGSVKDLEVTKKPTPEAMGVGKFHFLRPLQRFRLGRNARPHDGKGAALCLMGAYCFERLEEKGVKTHYRGLVGENGKTVTFEELEAAQQHDGS